MASMKFRKKPVVIEAIKWDKNNWKSIDEFLPLQRRIDIAVNSPFHIVENELYINTLEGKMHVQHGDWVIKGVKGEFYPCKPDIFEQTYEEVIERTKGPQDFVCDHCGQYSSMCRC